MIGWFSLHTVPASDEDHACWNSSSNIFSHQGDKGDRHPQTAVIISYLSFWHIYSRWALRRQQNTALMSKLDSSSANKTRQVLSYQNVIMTFTKEIQMTFCRQFLFLRATISVLLCERGSRLFSSMHSVHMPLSFVTCNDESRSCCLHVLQNLERHYGPPEPVPGQAWRGWPRTGSALIAHAS